MSPIKTISIPEPCSQSWQQMKENEQGRYCLHCAKTVVDFTKMTSDEILVYLASAAQVCGRFDPTQLTSLNQRLKVAEPVKTFNWRKWLVAAGLAGAGMLSRANAQIKPSNVPGIEQAPQDSSRKRIMPADSTGAQPGIYHISGTVIGADDKLPVVGAYVQIKGTEVKAITDVNGCFQLSVQKRKAVLVVSYIGYETKETKVSFEKSTELNVALKVTPSVLGGLVITRESRMSRVEMLNQYMPWPVNRLFK